MKKKLISISSLSDTCEFIERAREVDGDVILYRGQRAVDAKSLIGTFSFDMKWGVVIEYPDTAKEFEEYISQFEISK